jgi:hypothetical protein
MGFRPRDDRARHQQGISAGWSERQRDLQQRRAAGRRQELFRPRTIACVLAIAAVVTFGFGLTTSACSGGDEWANRHCRWHDDVRVSADRVVTLFAGNYVYVSARDSVTTRGAYVSRVDEIVHDAYDVVNRIFRDDGINLQIVPLSVDVRIDELLDIYDDANGSRGPTESQIAKAVQNHQQHLGERSYEIIGVHWLEWFGKAESTTYDGWAPQPQPVVPCTTIDRCNFVFMDGGIHAVIRSPGTYAEFVGQMLAHEFGHYFNLSHVTTDPANLMCAGECLGTVLTTSQRDVMWTTVNTNSFRTPLNSATCDLPVTAAPRLPEVR